MPKVATRKTVVESAPSVSPMVAAIRDAMAKVRKLDDAADELHALEHDLGAAKKNEDFLEAHRLKTAIDAIKRDKTERRMLRGAAVQALIDTCAAAGHEIYPDDSLRMTRVTMYRVFVAEPAEPAYCDDVVYTDGEATVQLSLGIHRFEGEARNIAEWAALRGLAFKVKKVLVEI